MRLLSPKCGIQGLGYVLLQHERAVSAQRLPGRESRRYRNDNVGGGEPRDIVECPLFRFSMSVLLAYVGSIFALLFHF